jgi:hypothetical protein
MSGRPITTRSAPQRIVGPVLVALAAACEPLSPDPHPTIILVNGTAEPVALVINNAHYPAIPPATTIEIVAALGTYAVGVRRGAEEVTGRRPVTFPPGARMLVVAVDSAVPIPIVVGNRDSSRAPAFGRLRVAHFAAAVPALELWRFEPGANEWLSSTTPLTFGQVSGYFEGRPGWWRVLADGAQSAGSVGDTVAITAPLFVGRGTSWTVVLVARLEGGVASIALEH